MAERVSVSLLKFQMYMWSFFCFSQREQTNAVAAERSAVEIRLLQDKVGL